MLGIFLRFLMALALVFTTWNPSGWSYAHWLMHDFPHVTAPMAVTGVILVIGWFLYLHATLESLGFVGLVLALALFGTLTWLVFDLGWLTPDNEVLSYVILVVAAAILALGMAWAHVWRRFSGRIEEEEH